MALAAIKYKAIFKAVFINWEEVFILFLLSCAKDAYVIMYGDDNW